MISDLFFYGKLKDADNLIIYEEEFVLLYLTIKLKYYTYFEKEDVERVLVEFYGEKNIKSKKIITYAETVRFLILAQTMWILAALKDRHQPPQTALQSKSDT